MDKTMTLEQVRDEIRLMNGGGLPTSQQIGEWADAIDAAIKAREAEPPCSFAEALNVMEGWALRGNVLHGDDVLRFRATANKLAPPAQPKVEVTDAMVERALKAPHGGYRVNSFILLKSPTNIRALMRAALEAALSQEPQS